MIEPKKPLKKKDQISFDEQEAIRLQAEFDEEERLAREKDEANLAQRLQADEQEQFTTEQKATLFKELLEQRRKNFNMEGWKHKDLKSKDFDSIKELFDKAFKKVDDVQETTKVDDDQEAAKIKELMKIVPDEEEVAIDAIPLATKPPTIVD
ncbi:hypothetical protein Tco_0276905 [Tanacetum coccineum]